MPKRGDRKFFELECTSCKRRNYSTNKNPKTTTDRLEVMKFCKFENKQVLHKETR